VKEGAEGVVGVDGCGCWWVWKWFDHRRVNTEARFWITAVFLVFCDADTDANEAEEGVDGVEGVVRVLGIGIITNGAAVTATEES